MPTLRIEGYNYGTSQVIGLNLVWYVYGGQFNNASVSSWGSYIPDIYLSNENGYVVIFINDRPYYQRFKITAFAQGLSETASWFQGWTSVDEPLAGVNQTLLPYSNSFAGNIGMPYGIWSANGNVGIGTSLPNQKLEVAGDAVIAHYGYTPSDGAGTSNLEVIGSGVAGGNSSMLNLGHVYNGRKYTFGIAATAVSNYNAALTFFTSTYTGSVQTTERMRINNEGNVGIGTESPSEKLSVNGNIKAKKIIVTQTGWSDYVFDKNYKLKSLEQVAAFIKENNHLPEVPTAKEVEAKGINVGDTQALLLKKIEELTLYMIEMKKDNDRLKKQVNTQSEEIRNIKNKIKPISPTKAAEQAG